MAHFENHPEIDRPSAEAHKYQVAIHNSDGDHNDTKTFKSDHIIQYDDSSISYRDSKHPIQTTTRLPVQTTTRQFWFACIVFLSTGMTNFYGYSSCLNASHAIQAYLYPDSPTLADTLTAVFMSFDFLVTALLSFFGSLNQSLIVVGLSMMSLGTLGLLLTCQFIPGSAGAALLHVFCAVVGSGSSISCSATFTLASRLRNPVFPATVSTGGGLTGVVSFGIWMLLMQGIYPYNKDGVSSALSWLFGFGVFLPILAFILNSIFMRLDYVKKYLKADSGSVPSNCVCRHAEGKYTEVIARSGSRAITAELEFESPPPPTSYDPELFARKSSDAARESNEVTVVSVKGGTQDVASSSEKPKDHSSDVLNRDDATTMSSIIHQQTEPCRVHTQKKKTLKQRGSDWWGVLSRCYPAVILNFIVCFMTYLLFPVVGPLRWAINSTQTDVITGIFQFGDFFGRYLPILGDYMPFLRPQLKASSIFVACRVVFIATFVLSHRLPSSVIFGDFWFQIIQTLLLATSMGFITTVMMVKVPTFIDDDDKLGKSKANSLGVFGILLGISAGQWASKLLVL